MVTALEAVERYLVPHRIAKLMSSVAVIPHRAADLPCRVPHDIVSIGTPEFIARLSPVKCHATRPLLLLASRWLLPRC